MHQLTYLSKSFKRLTPELRKWKYLIEQNQIQNVIAIQILGIKIVI